MQSTDKALFWYHFRIGVDYFCAEIDNDAVSGAIDLLEESGEVGRGAGDGGHPEGSAVPDGGFVEFGDGDVEGVAELVFEGADDLAAVLEGLGVIDLQFEGKAA